ncbi:beta-ketoacyl synthase N-terminal-like domain-containing protein [Nocardia nepalensis]|uniref:beta-ketoacyl synthase N-terminal-like domain-containing protein n=1 Tax=Nocardia nepalensis TaxID=3375448 RepID=UPI003B672773
MPESPLSVAAAVVGLGALFPGAPDTPTFWRNIVEGVDAITEVPASRWDPTYYEPDAPAASDHMYCHRGGFIDELATFDPARHGIMPFAAAGTEPDQLLALRVATEAIDDAGGEDRLPDRSRVGIILGRGGYLSAAGVRLDQRVRTAHQLVATLRELVPGLAEAELTKVREAFQACLGPERPEAAIGLVPNLAASLVASRLDLGGPAYVVDAACASALIAVDQAIRELASGRCDAVIAGGVHHTHDIVMWSVFTQLGALSRSQTIRPFHRAADGMLIGEGTGMVLLKRLEDAQRDGDRIYAVIRGTGVSSDGRASTLMAPRTQGQVLALQRAWHIAGLDPTAPASIGLLEAHGTATPLGDETELATLTRVFGPGNGAHEGRAADPDIGLGSVKSMIGHAMPAAGIAGLIKAILAVHHGVLPPTLHCEEPHRAIAGTRFAPVTQARPWDGPAHIPRRAAVDAFGFGGINTHVIVEQAPAASTAVAAVGVRRAAEMPRSTNRHSDIDGERLLLLTGADSDEIARSLAVDDARLLERDDAASLAVPGGPSRLAIVAPDPRRLAVARKIVARGTPWRGRNDIYFEPSPLLNGTGGIAFLFPGLEPDIEYHVDDVAEHFGLAVPRLRRGSHFIEQAVDAITVGRLFATALGELGVVPNLVAGHSLGEWTAMVVGGIYTRESLDGFLQSLGPDFAQPPDLVYAALGCSAERAVTILGDLAGATSVVVSHDNCPHQSVICGRPDRIRAAMARFRDHAVLAQLVPVRTGFHTPMIEPYLAPAHDALRQLSLQPPDVPVWSATSLAPFPDAPEEIRGLVIRHLIQPVRFRQLIDKLYDSGIRAFIQVGPGSLPGFVEDTLRGREHLVVAADAPGRTGLDQLRRVAAALWAAGRSPHFHRLPGARMSTAQSATVMQLDLGNPLVHIDGAVEPLSISTGQNSRPVDHAHDHPVLAEFDTLLTDVTAEARSVVDAWRAGGISTAPVAGAPVAPTAEITITQVCSLETMPELVDHSLAAVPAGWPDPSDAFPVVPLTVMLEMMADAARALLPGRVLVGWARVRAIRWLVAAPPTTVTIHAEVDGHGPDGVERVTVRIEGHASGTVLLAGSYPVPPAPSTEPLTGERPPVVDAPAVYTDHWAFHGPRFAGIADILCSADNGHRGVLVNLPTRGALLDAAGQLIGHWAQISLDANRVCFPVSVEAIHVFGPYPEVGARLTQTVRTRQITDTEVCADSELVDGTGRLWARIESWTDHRFASDEVTWPMKFAPESTGIGEMQPGDWCLVRERWPDTGSRELAMRRYLRAAERAEYERLTPLAQRQWLLGRIAGKDAVRNWYWGRGGGPVYPCEIGVGTDERGQTYVVGRPIPPDLRVCIAQSECRGRAPGLGVALAGTGPVGIDIRAVAQRAGTADFPLTDGERAQLDRLAGDRTTWSTRFWTAKEAVAKARGTDRRAEDFVVSATGESDDGDEVLTVKAVGGDSTTWRVRTRLVGGPNEAHVVAWTGTDDREDAQ